MKTIQLNEIQKEIHDNFLDLKSGVYDVYVFCADISKKHFKKIDPEWGERTEEDPYTDLIFSLLEINRIELY